ncbi:MAG: class A beta-lactamase-related serine hydrolase [Gammaproteobacteria bacterium]|nr:MAG: class A beta-lactamase-related serine hydrolase [Gammaproteobacteria bacterium]
MNINLLRVRVVAVFLFGGLSAWVPYGALADTMEMDPEKYAALKAFADSRLSETKVPGAGVGIIKDGKVIFAGGFGTRDLNTGEPINSQTAYLIGSSTKPFTVTAIAILAEEGVLDWDERVQTYMPSFKFKDEYVSEHLTLRDLGSHRSGVVDEPEWMGSTLSRGEMIESMSDFEQSFGFREKFEYNGSGFMILGHMATLASKTKFEDVVIDRVTKPLGMENTIWSDLSGPNPPYTDNVAYPHVVEDGEARRIDFMFEGEAIRPSGTMTSNIDDMLKFVQFHIQQGELNGKRLLSVESHEELITPNSISSYGAGLSQEKHPAWQELYGLGWWLGNYNGHRGVHHGGNSTGTLSQVFYMPDNDFGVVTFVNVEDFLSDELVLFIVDLYKDELQ